MLQRTKRHPTNTKSLSCACRHQQLGRRLLVHADGGMHVPPHHQEQQLLFDQVQQSRPLGAIRWQQGTEDNAVASLCSMLVLSRHLASCVPIICTGISVLHDIVIMEVGMILVDSELSLSVKSYLSALFDPAMVGCT